MLDPWFGTPGYGGGKIWIFLLKGQMTNRSI
jgi:hypothetical protein